MTEVVVRSDRKTIFINSKFVILLVIASSVPYSLVSASSLQLQPSGSRFSSVLLSNSPFRKTLTEVSNPNPEIPSTTSESPAAVEILKSSTTEASSGDSLWGVIKKSFSKNKSQLPNLSKNSVFASPSLKSPRQAWEDLITNAKSGFKNKYSPFQFSETVASNKKATEKQSENNEESLRSPRGSAWSLPNPPTFAWDTMKVLWDVNKDVASHVWNKHVVPQNVQTLSPVKTAILKPISHIIDLKSGITQVYKDKLKDLAYLNFVHKESLANDVRSLFSPIGFLKPSIPSQSGWGAPQQQAPAVPSISPIQSGWGPPPQAVVIAHEPEVVAEPAHYLVADITAVKKWAEAAIKLSKYLALSKLRLKAELFKGLPHLVHFKIKLVYALLLLIAKKDWTAVHHILHILNSAAWKGKDAFFRVVLKDNPFNYQPLYTKYGPEPILAPSPAYGVDLTTDSYGYNAPAKQQQTYSQSEPTNQYQIPVEPTVSTNPLYSYPSYSAPSQQEPPQQLGQYGYPTLPPVVTSYNQPAQKGKLVDIPSFVVYKSSSSEPSETKHSGFLSQLVQSFGTIKDKRTSETSESSSDRASRFSLKLLNSGFSSSSSSS